MVYTVIFWFLRAIFVVNVFFVRFNAAFNVEKHHYASYQSEDSSMFGFTVALHRERNQGWILVGAPESKSVYQQTREISRPGAVFKCRFDADRVCEEVPFDSNPNHMVGSKPVDNKNLQWFGATLSSSGRSDGSIVACAPRYVWFTKELIRRDPVGTCYVSDGFFNKFEEFSPCRTINWGYHRQGSCQAGFSAAINSESDRLYVGAPGSFYWQGQMYSIDAHATFNFTPGVFQETYGAKGSVHQQSLETRPAVFSTREGEPQDDDSYMGYSTVMGKFRNHDQYDGIVVGMPRGASLRGKVLFFTWDLHNYKNISCTSQIGSYFGNSLAAADVDGDGLTDLIVGAPLHTESNTEGKYDVGRIYVFYQNGGFDKHHFIDGFTSKSRFGYSLVGLGDMNQDGYEDFAVGAPYDGETGLGAVYIFYGSAEGVLEKPSQKIEATDFRDPYPPSTFGFSLAGGLDLDGNEYPDMAVGAYLSNKAYFLRARPVVRVDASVHFLTASKQIDLSRKNCTQPNNRDPVACTKINFCINYSGKGIPNYIDLELEYVLDSKKTVNPRLLFLENNKRTFKDRIRLQKDSEKTCRTKDIYIKNNIRDKLTTLEAEVKYSLVDLEGQESYQFQRNPRSVLTPVLDLKSPASRKDSIVIQKNCGPDNICIPDLRIGVKTVDKYYLDARKALELEVTIGNHGEDAFETTFQMQYPEGIYYNHVVVKNQSNILCAPKENRTIHCDIANPLPAGKIAQFVIVLQTYHIDNMAPRYEFDLFVNNTNPEDVSTRFDNHKHISIEIAIDAELELTGKSHSPNLYFNTTNFASSEIVREADIGPQVSHIYYLRNKGPATIQEAQIIILWPSATLSGNDFLYLLDQPHTLGHVTCEAIESNSRHYRLDRYSKSFWERIGIDSNSGEYSNAERLEGIQIESGRGIATGISGAGLKPQKLDQEIKSSGDGSFVHQHRHESTSGGSRTSFSENRSYGETRTQQNSNRNQQNAGTIRNYNENINQQTTQNRNFDGGVGRVAYNQGSRFDHNQQNGRNPFSTASNENYFASNGFIGEDGTEETHNAHLYTEMIDGIPRMKWKNTTVIRDSQGKVLRTFTQEGDASEAHFTNQKLIDRINGFIDGGRAERQENWRDSSTRRYHYVVEWITENGMAKWRNSTTIQDFQGNILKTLRTYGENREEFFLNELRNANLMQSRQDNRQGIENIKGQYPGHHRQHSTTGNFNWDARGGYGEDQQRNYYGQRQNRTSYGNMHRQNIDLTGQGGFREKPPGFTVTSFDLGSGGEAGLNGNMHRSGGVLVEDEQAGQRQSSGSWSSERHWSQSGQIPPTYFNNVEESIGRDNVPTDRPNLNNKYRGKRQVDPDYKNIEQCKTTQCTFVQCTVRNLAKDKEVSVGLRSRLNVRTLKEISSPNHDIKFSSMMFARISRLPYVGKPQTVKWESKEIVTKIPAQEPEVKPYFVPLWIVVLSAVAGTLALLLLIFLLYKLGFFKRHRPSNAPERQPLNRDEHL